MLQEQLARQRQLWQGAEERLAKLQVGEGGAPATCSALGLALATYG